MNAAEGDTLVELPLSMVAPATGIWFLWSLTIFFVATKLLLNVNRRLAILGGVVVSIAAMTLTDADAPKQAKAMLDIISHRNTLIYFVFFFTAATAPSIVKSLGSAKIIRASAATVLAFGLGTLAMRVLPDPIDDVSRFFTSVCGVAGLFLLARILDGWDVTAKPLRYIGLNTLPIYLAQGPIIIVFVTLLRHTDIAEAGSAIIFLAPVGVAIVVWLTLQAHHLLIRGGARWLYRLPHIGAFSQKRVTALAGGSDH